MLCDKAAANKYKIVAVYNVSGELEQSKPRIPLKSCCWSWQLGYCYNRHAWKHSTVTRASRRCIKWTNLVTQYEVWFKCNSQQLHLTEEERVSKPRRRDLKKSKAKTENINLTSISSSSSEEHSPSPSVLIFRSSL